MAYRKQQTLNEWVEMLHAIYGLSQNYARTQYEILAHLSEVTGNFGKYLFKLQQPDKAIQFLPKMFGWTAALLKKVRSDRANYEEIILTKYPGVCSYCTNAPCKCERGKKRPVDPDAVRDAYNRIAPGQDRSLNGFQILFRKIYEPSWLIKDAAPGSVEALDALQKMHTRLIEEMSEVGEAVRFEHLYPSNFDNELADYTAWLFALVSSMHKTIQPARDVFLIEDLFWPAYPGICTVCMLDICDCRPGPVRELMSKPSLRDLRYTDGLTQAGNKTLYDRHLAEIESGALPLPIPISCVRIDIDDFKRFNEAPFDHGVGDEALKHLVNVIRQKTHTRDRLYRVGGDEFVLLCPDLSSQEAEGMMTRVAATLKNKQVPATGKDGARPPFMTLSIGIVEAKETAIIGEALKTADTAAGRSKAHGKDRITVA
jgi:diguanylate cyclase (GGDEF)-like protein